MTKSSLYFLLRDILSGFPSHVEENLVSALNSQAVVKETINAIFNNEVHEQKPSYQILLGSLIIKNQFLRKLPHIAFYEVIEVCDALKYCFKVDKRKNIKRMSSIVIFRLFVTICFEFIILPMHHEEDKEFMERFTSSFSREDMDTILSTLGFFEARFIFREHGYDLGLVDKAEPKMISLIDKFYEFKV